MRLGSYFIIIFMCLSCNKTTSKNPLIGTWHYSKELFLEEQKLLQDFKIDLSDKYKTIKMIFNNREFISYLDNQVTKGQWKIQNDSLYMFLESHGWNRYDYKCLNDNLIIYDRDFIIALERKIE